MLLSELCVDAMFENVLQMLNQANKTPFTPRHLNYIWIQMFYIENI